MSGATGVVLFLLLLLLVFVIIWGVATRNSFVTKLNLVAESWRQIDVELRRRYDLIPNLVRVVQGYAEYERGLLESLTAARSQAMAAQSLAQRASAEDSLGQAIHSILVQAEAYPQLRASEQFLSLQQELANTENRIAAGRRLYNGNVRVLNTARNVFPANVIGSMMGVQPAEYFEVLDPAQRAVVQVPPSLGAMPGYPVGGGYPAPGYPGYPATTAYPVPSPAPGYPPSGPGYLPPGYGTTPPESPTTHR